MTRDPEVEALLDKQAITEGLHYYCRAVDRKNYAALETVYWPEGTDDHAIFNGGVKDFVAFAEKAHRGMVTQHSLGNVIIEWIAMSKTARVESYFHAYHERKTDNGTESYVVGGRYLDKWEKRGSEWRILARQAAIDYYNYTAPSAAAKSGKLEAMPITGTVWPNDPIYRLYR